MADTENSGTEGAPAAQPDGDGETGAMLTVNAQYIKDLSFEAPGSPQVLAAIQKSPPDININVDVGAKTLQGNLYEVVLNISAKCTTGSTVAFIVELEYGGVFTLNIPEEHIQPVLLIECPRLLFPFARNVLAEVTRDGGFPPLMLGLVDFATMYQNSLKDRAPNPSA